MRVFVLMALLEAGLITASLMAQPAANPNEDLFGRAVFNKTQTIESRIKVEKVTSTAAVLRDVSGNFSQHVKFFTEMMDYVPKYVASLGTGPAIAHAGIGAGGACFGVYPVDPDAVTNPADLKWQVGMHVAQPPAAPEEAHAEALKSAMHLLQARKPKAPYHVRLMAETDALTLMTDVKNSPFDGDSMYRWMLENGYVQTAPTRMEYLSHSGDPLDMPVRIIIPAVKRRSGLTLPAEKK